MTSPDMKLVREALFPDDERRPDGSFVDHSADGNLEAVIIEMEMKGGDKVQISSLKDVHSRLLRVRQVLVALDANAGEPGVLEPFTQQPAKAFTSGNASPPSPPDRDAVIEECLNTEVTIKLSKCGSNDYVKGFQDGYRG